MKKRIVLDLFGDFLIIGGLLEGILFAIYYFVPSQLPYFHLNSYILKYYWVAALGTLCILLLYFGISFWFCQKLYLKILQGRNMRDSDLLEYYKEADKCCQYKTRGGIVFINTSHGILCLDSDDVYDYKLRRVHHTRRRRYTSGGYTRRLSHEQDYYTYHFKLITRYGTFRNTVANNTVLEKLSEMFR